MGQKVNPHGLRVGVIKDWDSRWYARNDKVGDLLVEDYNIRKDLKKRLYSAGIAKIEIERSNARVKINLHCSRLPQQRRNRMRQHVQVILGMLQRPVRSQLAAVRQALVHHAVGIIVHRGGPFLSCFHIHQYRPSR